jgi:hypothetical protein
MQLAQQGKCRNVELSVSGPVRDSDDRIQNGWRDVTTLLYCFLLDLFLAIGNFSMGNYGKRLHVCCCIEEKRPRLPSTLGFRIVGVSVDLN